MITFTSINVFAKADDIELPRTINRNGKIYEIYEPSRRTNVAEKSEFSNATLYSNYRVLASDVALYVDNSHGHGGDQFASGYVRATAPHFTARAEVWKNGRREAGGYDTPNRGDTAYATSHLCVYIDNNRYPRIFYNW
ncbi:hypothetical protein ABID14_000279 [Peptoniphilus olsenii]|uniref:YkuD domain-containing protein n=1 Tax=Peptoniphilus olsenii TaxID=411570 RepID=A0ABV2JA40_9FIRM